MINCLRWILGYPRLEIWCKISLTGDWCLCTVLRTHSTACYYWIGSEICIYLVRMHSMAYVKCIWLVIILIFHLHSNIAYCLAVNITHGGLMKSSCSVPRIRYGYNDFLSSWVISEWRHYLSAMRWVLFAHGLANATAIPKTHHLLPQ